MALRPGFNIQGAKLHNDILISCQQLIGHKRKHKHLLSSLQIIQKWGLYFLVLWQLEFDSYFIFATYFG